MITLIYLLGVGIAALFCSMALAGLLVYTLKLLDPSPH